MSKSLYADDANQKQVSSLFSDDRPEPLAKSPEPSEPFSRRFGRYLDQYRLRHRLSVRQLCLRLASPRSASTIRRLINADRTTCSVDVAWPLVERLASEMGWQWEELWVYLAQRQITPYGRFSELEFGNYCPPARRPMAALFHLTKRHLTGSPRLLSFGELPAWVLPDRLIAKYLRSACNSLLPNAMRSEGMFCRRERREFLEPENPSSSRIILLSRRGLEVGGLLPTFTQDERDESRETIIEDGVNDRRLGIGIVEDMHPDFPSSVATHFATCLQTVTVEGRLVVKRLPSGARVYYERTGVRSYDVALEHELTQLQKLELWNRQGLSTPTALAELERYLK